MHAGVDDKAHRTQQFTARQRADPVERVVIKAQLVAEAFGIKTPALAISGKAVVAHEIGQFLVLVGQHRLEVMARIAFMHVERDRSAQLALRHVVAAEIEGAGTRTVDLAGIVGGGEVEGLAILFVRLDPQRGLRLVEEQAIHQRIDLAADLVPGFLQVGLGGVCHLLAVAGLGPRLCERCIDARDFGKAGLVDFLCRQRQRGHFLDAESVIGIAVRVVGRSDAGAGLRQVFIGEEIAHPLHRDKQRALHGFAVGCGHAVLLGLREAGREGA